MLGFGCIFLNLRNQTLNFNNWYTLELYTITSCHNMYVLVYISYYSCHNMYILVYILVSECVHSSIHNRSRKLALWNVLVHIVWHIVLCDILYCVTYHIVWHIVLCDISYCVTYRKHALWNVLVHIVWHIVLCDISKTRVMKCSSAYSSVRMYTFIH